VRLCSDDDQRSHHVIVFVVEDMAVPDVVAFDIEGSFDECNCTGVADDGVLASGFSGFRGLDSRGVHGSTGGLWDASYDFELDLVQVDGVCIFGEVVNFPCFAGTDFGFFGGGVHPAHGHGHIHLHVGIEFHGPQHAGDGTVEVIFGFGAEFVE